MVELGGRIKEEPGIGVVVVFVVFGPPRSEEVPGLGALDGDGPGGGEGPGPLLQGEAAGPGPGSVPGAQVLPTPGIHPTETSP